VDYLSGYGRLFVQVKARVQHLRDKPTAGLEPATPSLRGNTRRPNTATGGRDRPKDGDHDGPVKPP
jgi:hypothetical protein